MTFEQAQARAKIFKHEFPATGLTDAQICNMFFILRIMDEGEAVKCINFLYNAGFITGQEMERITGLYK